MILLPHPGVLGLLSWLATGTFLYVSVQDLDSRIYASPPYAAMPGSDENFKATFLSLSLISHGDNVLASNP
jgi:hypothetical protein